MRETFKDKFDNSKIGALAYVPVESVISSWEVVEVGFLERARLSEKEAALDFALRVYSLQASGGGEVKRWACR